MKITSFYKTIYYLIPFKKELFIFIKLLNPPENIYQHLHFKGFFKVKIDELHQFKIYHPGTIEENKIFWKGLFHGWEKKSISLWAQLVINSNVIMDIGANTGLYGLVAKSLNTNSNIFSFEPLPSVYKILNKNIQTNSYNIQSFQVGLSNYNGLAKVYLPENTDFAYSVTVNQNTISHRNTKELSIDVLRLDTFIEQNNITSIDLMKIDVETHEVEVLQGMGRYLKEFKPTIIIEILNDEIADKLNEIFNGLGYLYFNIDDDNNSIRKVAKIEKSDYWNFLLCNEKIAREIGLI